MRPTGVIQEQVRAVSRSFAFVIEQLREPLRREVQVAYLLFRLGDNIEDTSSLDAAQKAALLEGLLSAFGEGRPYRAMLEDLRASEWADLTPAEQQLFAHTDTVIEAFGALDPDAREALLAEAEAMFRGMARFQREYRRGAYLTLPGTDALEEYCYYVAGTVGDFLTHRFFALAPWLDPARRARLLGTRRSLALVLQVTNILRDVRDDHEHGHVFYPRSLFERFDAARLMTDEHAPDVLRAGQRLAQWLLPEVARAVTYVAALPRREPTWRVFCAIPLAMALQTLTLTVGNPEILGPSPVKISRAATRRTAVLAHAVAPSTTLLRIWLGRLARELRARVPPAIPPVN